MIAGTNEFDQATNPHPYPTDFAYEIRIQQMRILAGSVTSLDSSQRSNNIIIVIVIMIFLYL